jgi:Uma2 family endonuclease
MLLQDQEPRTKRWTREEFYALAEEGYFRGKRVQLIDGEIIETAPQGHPHSKCITYLTRWVTKAFGDEFLIRIQMPLNASAWSDPEPDVAVVPGPLEAYQDHPERSVLVIEVGDSSVRHDRGKARIYAEAGVQEYWLVNLPESQVEVYRPKPGAAGQYAEPLILKAGQSLAPIARPDAKLDIAELFK